MSKNRVCAVAIGLCMAVFGILYPEYVLLPGVCEYISEVKQDMEKKEGPLWTDPDNIRISSYLLDFI